jgi:hypothetical protein
MTHLFNSQSSGPMGQAPSQSSGITRRFLAPRRSNPGSLNAGTQVAVSVNGSAATPPGTNRDTLISVFLHGGMDGLTAVVPFGDVDPGTGGRWLDFHRPTLAIPSPGQPNGAVDLDGFFGLAPAAAPLATPFQAGDLAIVHGVGSPDPTRSHFSATQMIQAANPNMPGTQLTSGWLARHLSTIAAVGAGDLRAVSQDHIMPQILAEGPGARSPLYGDGLEPPGPLSGFPADGKFCGTSLGTECSKGADLSRAATVPVLTPHDMPEPLHAADQQKTSLPSELASRRTVLGAGLGVAAAAQGFSMQGPLAGGGPMIQDDLVMLLHHATQGITVPELARARSLGYSAWLNEQLEPALIDDLDCDQRLQNLPSLTMTGQELWVTYGPPNNLTPQLLGELRGAALIRSIFSKRQVFERLVEFWTDHFNIYQNEDEKQRMLKVVDDREVIRANALGSFRDLLLASARSASMSYYLDNYASTANSINENYARELLELHTLGVDGPYTETDVVEVARCLTGWAFLPPASGNAGEFVFKPGQHDNGAKVVLGTVIPAGGGESDGITVMDLLASHPVTAEFISRKMISWFLRVDPEQQTVDRIKAVYLATGGDIKSMLREILQPDVLLEANPWGNPKCKRPFHLLVGLIRQTGADVLAVQGMNQVLQTMGHAPFDWHAPDGYNDRIGAWGGAVLNRWSLASALLEGHVQGVVISQAHVAAMLQGVPPSQVVAALDTLLCAGQMSIADRTLLQSYVDSLPQWGFAAAREVIALAASTPSYQTY